MFCDQSGDRECHCEEDKRKECVLSDTQNNFCSRCKNIIVSKKIWKYVCPGQVEGTKAKFNVNHFSKYSALDITPAMMDYFDVLVKAYAPDDTKIISEFKDYLINDCDVMDFITIYNDFYYRPRNLLVSGDYFKNGVENKNTLADFYGEEIDESKTLYGITASSTSQSEYIKKVD